MFFDPFPTINYIINEDTSIRVVNIVVSNMVKHWVVDRMYTYEKYEAIGSESLESISYKLYGRSDYYWVILLINNLIDPFTLWYGNDVLEYCKRKYGDPYAIHHYEDVRDNSIIDDFDSNKYNHMDTKDIPTWVQRISNVEYEELQVANKRELYVISKRHIGNFVEDYRKAIRG